PPQDPRRRLAPRRASPWGAEGSLSNPGDGEISMTTLASLPSWSTPSSTQLLARLLESPDLPTKVAALEPLALAKLIDRVGLEDAGELVAFATTEQLAHVFDEDLWNSERAGEDDRFDSGRFVLWLEVMLEGGDELLAKRMVELPEDLVTLAFHE